MSRIQKVASDTRPTRLTYKDGGVAVDITGYTFTLKIGTTPTPKQIACTIADAANGVLTIPWGASDLVAGVWPMEMMVVDGSGTPLTHKLQDLEVLARIV